MGEPGCSSSAAATASLAASGRAAGFRVEAAALHLLGEAQRIGHADVESGREHERAAALAALEPPLPRELVEGAPDRDQRAAVHSRQLALGGQALADLELARIERGSQVNIDLVMQRDRAELEPVARHDSSGSSEGACARRES